MYAADVKSGHFQCKKIIVDKMLKGYTLKMFQFQIGKFHHLLLYLTLCLLVSSADILCKQFGPRPGPTECRTWSGYRLFHTLMVFLKEFFEKVDFNKNQQTTKKHEKLISRQINSWPTSVVCWYPLQTVWTQIRPDKMSDLIWIQTVEHSADISERIFLKVDFEKISWRQKKKCIELPSA